MKFLLITRSLWSEPPRIRHQLAKLLLSKGHEVGFVEKAEFLKKVSSEKVAENLTLFRCGELVHHQLRVFGGVTALNAAFVSRQLSAIVNDFEPEVIINFNYDYGFCRSHFASLPFLTVINDDFLAMSRPWALSQATRALEKTCGESDRVLCVSYPLESQAQEKGGDALLFLPWMDRSFQFRDSSGCDRDTVLYFGFIDYRIDWEIVFELADSGKKLRFIGPVGRGCDEKLNSLLERENVEHLSGRPIDEVDFSDVICSILPYRVDLKEMQACTANNRVFQLLARGIPLVYADLPHLLEAPPEVIYRAGSVDEFLSGIDFHSMRNDSSQAVFESFLKAHTSDARYELLMSCVDVKGG